MEVHLTPDQEAFVRQAIEAGRLQSGADAVAEASIARGEGRVVTEESMKQLAREVKQGGLARLATQRYPR